LKGSFDEASNACESLRQVIRNLQQQTEQEETAHFKQESEIESLQLRIKEYIQECEQLRNSTATAQNKLLFASEQNEQLQARCDALVEQSQLWIEEKHSLQESITRTKNEAISFHSQVETASQDLLDTRNRLEKALQHASSLEKEIIELRQALFIAVFYIYIYLFY
jgi:chromosome segregation ATPase